jgi:hypothetical protein
MDPVSRRRWSNRRIHASLPPESWSVRENGVGEQAAPMSVSA